jgi:cellulose synthase/poly-beta-1,6-N-acetylglucosamine synthase-like glycosyltransferase
MQLQNTTNPKSTPTSSIYTKTGLTVIVPAYNEANVVADTIHSLQNQTNPPEQIIVVDDHSSDGTGEIASDLGVTVVRPSTNTGSKAGAQSFALPLVRTEYTVALDADTTLAADALERLLIAMEDKEVVASCGCVLPRHVRSIWERGRYVEYLFAFTFFKQIQDYYERPLISSGCFSAYRTEALRQIGGWSDRTMAEDMDLTWSFYEGNKGKVRFVPEAVCYPIEPHDFGFMRKQLRRWSHGFVQNVMLHWRGILHVSYLRSMVTVALWDAAMAPLFYLLLLPLLAVLLNPLFLSGYIIDAPAVLIPTLVGAASRREVCKALLSYPAFFVLRMVNGVMMLKALWSQLVARKTLSVYEKGH